MSIYLGFRSAKVHFGRFSSVVMPPHAPGVEASVLTTDAKIEQFYKIRSCLSLSSIPHTPASSGLNGRSVFQFLCEE